MTHDRPLVEWSWLARNLDRVWDATVQHVALAGAAVAIGFAVSVALAALALRWRALYGPIIAFGGVLYTIPSLALFALLAPITGLSATTAVIALTSYTILILVRNIVLAIDGVPPHVVEAARGMGYTDRQVFWRIHVPLAAPVVIAGLRIASVTVIGLVTVTALLGQGGLGQLILSGFRVLPPYPTQILVGTALSVVLAVVVDVLLVALERLLTPWTRGAA
jgi:osmoprotectant transport system permease protein